MPYTPTAVKFDGTNDYLTRGGDLTGIADSKSGIFSCWVRWDGLDGVNSSILSIPYVAAGAFNAYKIATNQLAFEACNTATTLALNMKTSKQLASAKWYHILAAWDLATGATHLYVNDVSDKAVNTAANLAIDLTTGNCIIGATTSGAQKFDGALSELYFAPGQYLDLSVTANRHKFIDATGLPVDLGSNGSTPTGTAPAVYLKGDKTNFGTNSGTGGNFTVNGSLETASTTPATTAVNAVDFDGTADYLTRSADLTGIADGTSGILSFWCRIDGGDGSNRSILENLATAGSFDVRLNSGNTFRIHGNTSLPTNILYLLSNAVFLASPAWVHVLAAWDLSGATPTHLYINGVSDKNAAVATNGTIDYNVASPNWAIGATTAAAQKFNGAISELYFAPNQYLDLSVQANREKFILNKVPVSLGSDGSLPTGTAPAIYMPNRAALVGTNAGSGGNFTINGAPKDANSTPVYYYAEPVKFDGSTAYLTRGADLTGIVDGKSGTVSCWLRIDGGDGTTRQLLSNLVTAIRFYFRVSATNKISVNGLNSASAAVLSISSNTAKPAGPLWLHFIASWDMASGVAHLYVDNSNDLAASPTLVNDTIDYVTASPNWGVGAYTEGSNKFNGAIADLWFNTTYLDLSNSGNRAKFIDQSTLRPVPLGAKGELPTGSQPLLYLGRDAANFGKNLGSGGDFA